MGKTTVQDPTFGESTVETGKAFVKDIGDRADRNVRVEFRADHLRLPVYGWLDTESPAGDILARLRVGSRVRYRILTHRKASIDVSVPWDQVDKFDKVRDLVELALLEDEDQPPTPEERAATLEANLAGGTVYDGAEPAPAPRDTDDEATDPDQPSMRECGERATAQRTADRERRSQAATPAPAPRGGSNGGGGARRCSDCGGPLEGAVRPLGGGRYVHRDGCPPSTGDASPPPAKATPPDPDDGSAPSAAGARPEPRRPQRDVRPGVKVEEARPWEPQNTDGSPNRGSNEFASAVWAAQLAYRLCREEGEGSDPFDGDDRSAPGPVNLAHARLLAGWLCAAADATQAATRRDRRSDRMANSHKQAQRVVAMCLRAHPVPWTQLDDGDVRAAWLAALTEESVEVLAIACDLTDDPDGWTT